MSELLYGLLIVYAGLSVPSFFKGAYEGYNGDALSGDSRIEIALKWNPVYWIARWLFTRVD